MKTLVVLLQLAAQQNICIHQCGPDSNDATKNRCVELCGPEVPASPPSGTCSDAFDFSQTCNSQYLGVR